MSVVGTILLVVLVLIVLTIVGLVGFAGLAARRAEQAVPRVGRAVTVDGVSLNVLEEGSGPPIVMIHGLASQLQSFTYALAAKLRGKHRLIMIDRPGSGYSAPGRTATLKEQARLVAGLMDQLGIERALIVGHSLGGALSLALAVDHPAKVAGLALLAPATQPQSAPPDALKGLAVRSDLMRWILGWTLAIPASLRTRDATLHALFAPDAVPRDFGTRGGALLLARPWSYRAASRDLVEAGGEFATYAARHREIAAPVAVLFGDGDRILDPRLHGEGLRRSLPDMRYELVKDGGHMIPLVRADECAAFIERVASEVFAPATEPAR